MPSPIEATLSAVRDELGETADPLFVHQLAEACHQTVGYFAAPDDDFPDGDIATCLMLEYELRLSRGEIV